MNAYGVIGRCMLFKEYDGGPENRCLLVNTAEGRAQLCTEARARSAATLCRHGVRIFANRVFGPVVARAIFDPLRPHSVGVMRSSEDESSQPYSSEDDANASINCEEPPTRRPRLDPQATQERRWRREMLRRIHRVYRRAARTSDETEHEYLMRVTHLNDAPPASQ